MGPLERSLFVLDQATGFIVLVVVMALATLLATRLTRRGAAWHRGAWIVFVGWVVLVAAVPYLRALDQSSTWFYGLRGIPYGLLLASMLTLRPRPT